MDDKKKDKQLILLSILVAIAMWFYVMTNTNTSLTKTIKNVPLVIKNLESIENQGYELADTDVVSSVNVEVEASRSDLVKLDKDDLVASVDLQSPTEGIRSLNISVDSPTGVKVLETDPSQVNLKIEKIIDKKLPVSLSVSNSLKEGRILEVNEFYPQEITASGIRSQIEKVDKLVVSVDKEDYLDGKIHNLDIKAVDQDGKEVSGIDLSESEVSVSYLVSQTKEVDINLVTKSLKKSYSIKSKKAVPDTVIIKGEGQIISDIDSLDSQTIDLSKITKSTSGTVKLKLPDGVEIYDSENEINYSIEVEKDD